MSGLVSRTENKTYFIAVRERFQAYFFFLGSPVVNVFYTYTLIVTNEEKYFTINIDSACIHAIYFVWLFALFHMTNSS